MHALRQSAGPILMLPGDHSEPLSSGPVRHFVLHKPLDLLRTASTEQRSGKGCNRNSKRRSAHSTLNGQIWEKGAKSLVQAKDAMATQNNCVNRYCHTSLSIMSLRFMSATVVHHDTRSH